MSDNHPTQAAVSILEDFADGSIPLDEVAATLNQRGWIYAGADAELVTKLLADPHRNDHILQVDENGWTLQHPVIERVTGELFDCHIGQEHDQFNELWDTHDEGRYVAWLTEGVIWTEPLGSAT